MPIAGWLYPSIALAARNDPLGLVVGSSATARPASDAVVERARLDLVPQLERLRRFCRRSGPDDQWYAAAPVLLDVDADRAHAQEWLNRSGLAAQWSLEERSTEEHESGWAAHVERLRDIAGDRHELGEMPDDLAQVLACMAVGGPAVLALRTLARLATSHFPGLYWSDVIRCPLVRLEAARIAWGFRRLYDSPEGIAAVRARDGSEPYWRRALEYGIEGHLQSVLDEYGHVLADDARASSNTPAELAQGVARSLLEVLSLRTATLRVRNIKVSSGNDQVETDEEIPMRARFALQLVADRADEEKTGHRKQQVLQAFNSPFWPFVLATTSIGQEGLDFHRYCHAVVHWNLPSNPVDLEQREGRVHRYKGHVVRRNLATRLGLGRVADPQRDPWAQLFGLATAELTGSDLQPFWVFEPPAEGGAHIERHLPVLPFSSEIEQMARLRRALVLYRLAFGQPRQDDLLEELARRLPEADARRVCTELGIDLSPEKLK